MPSLLPKLRRLARTVVPRAAVLMYHRVAEPERDPWDLCVSPARFAEQMAAVAATGWAMSLDAYAAALRRGRPPRRAIVVTFDDGYADVLHAAAPILAEYRVPATVFITTDAIGREGEFWWDDLERCTPDPARYRERWARAAEMAPDARTDYVAVVRRQAGVEAQARATHRTLTAAECQVLSRQSGIVIGGHTVTHTPLSVLDEARQAWEIRQSIRRLETLTQRPVTTYSYPNGAYGPETVALLADAGIRAACTTQHAAVHRRTPLLELPRLHVRDVPAGAVMGAVHRVIGG